MSAEETRQDALPIEDDASDMERVERAYDAVTEAGAGCTEPHTELLVRRAERGLGSVLDSGEELTVADREAIYQVRKVLGTIADEATTTIDATNRAERARAALDGLARRPGGDSGGTIK